MAAQAHPARAFDESGYRALVERAAARFRSSGQRAYHFCRGKLRGDPVFAALLRDGHIENGARIVDLGCGQGVLAALLAAAAPSSHALNCAAPFAWTFRGFDLRAGAIASAQRALADLGERARFEVGDIRTVALPESDVIVLLDVLHYIDHEAQQSLLARAHRALAPGGKLLLRVGDPARGWRFCFTLFADWIVTLMRGTPYSRFWCRPLTEWFAVLEAIGFDVEARPMSEGTPFANVLLIANRQSDPRET